MEDEEEEEIVQEDAWAVISSYFEEKGLVRQQLDSFDAFIQNTMQEVVDEAPDLVLTPEPQHKPGQQPQPQVVLNTPLLLIIQTLTNLNRPDT